MTRDHVSASLHDAVLRRDRGCVKARFDPKHVCRDKYGVSHRPDVLNLLTVDHVHEGYGMMGKRAPSDMAHLVALCWAANVTQPPSRAFREYEREYLSRVEGAIA